MCNLYSLTRPQDEIRGLFDPADTSDTRTQIAMLG